MFKKFKKIIGILIAFLIILSIVFYVFITLTSDISDEELGQSPFKVEDSISSENNAEFQEILKIGASIIDITETWRNYKDESPQEYAVRLKIILQKNQHVIDQAKPELFFNCKFPSQAMEFNYMPLFNLFALMEKRIVYQILTNDFENAKKNIILSNQIHNNLIEKCTNLILFGIIKTGKNYDLSNIKLMINHESTTLDQKLSILEIEPGLISNQNFISIAHFNEYFLKSKMKNTSTLEINDYSSLPFVNSFVLQPNRSIRYHRNVFMKALAEVNKPTFNLNTDLKKIIVWDATLEKFYTPNSHGYEVIYKDLSAFEYTAKDVLIYNHYCNQLK